MTQQQLANVKAGKLPRGITCVIRITRTYQCDHCDNAMRHGKPQCSTCSEYNGLSSGTARDFITDPQRLHKLYDMTSRYYK